MAKGAGENDQIRGRRGPCPHFREDKEELYPPLDIFSKSVELQYKLDREEKEERKK